mmetsp:Transcript_125133/g.400804  ORF Transcript_125133/g.400804 Transcript_125133/m.400804 type:complete len:233 (+) Transcript_125133:317-1015(+)
MERPSKPPTPTGLRQAPPKRKHETCPRPPSRSRSSFPLAGSGFSAEMEGQASSASPSQRRSTATRGVSRVSTAVLAAPWEAGDEAVRAKHASPRLVQGDRGLEVEQALGARACAIVEKQASSPRSSSSSSALAPAARLWHGVSKGVSAASSRGEPSCSSALINSALRRQSGPAESGSLRAVDAAILPHLASAHATSICEARSPWQPSCACRGGSGWSWGLQPGASSWRARAR